MRHDSAIPLYLHSGTRQSVKDALGAFWSSVFRDQDFVDASLSARVLMAAQLNINVMEALSVRDHGGAPVFHREHWHPMLIRLSERNTGRGITVGMEDTPIIGPQPSDADVYLPSETFEIGGNATYSKVNTYPFTAMDGCSLVAVKSCICDSITSPAHMLLPDRDFTVSDGVLVIRKEQDPFDAGGYRVIEDEGDSIAVLWLCDAEFDTNNVGDFMGYPLGFDVKTTEKSAEILSALWDIVIFGVTPKHVNIALCAMFDVPVSREDETVESVSAEDDDGYKTVVTDKNVYRIDADILNDNVTTGVTLHAGDILTTEIHVYHSLSKDEVKSLVDSGNISSVSLPPGSVYGVDETVVLDNIDSEMQTGGWFKLNTGDTGDSAFWTTVRANATVDELTALFSAMKESSSDTTVNPLKTLGYVVLSNTILVRSTKAMCDDPCAGLAFALLSKLVPACASLVTVQDIPVSDSLDVGSSEETVTSTLTVPTVSTDSLTAAADSVAFTFVPVAATEV